ncbi:hypothetical protein DRQ07_05730 [candidate division KSB1 bacterium]|nr:MAG: hypothetical protein DRQ07_05730 [candidate division KSB1 bacterium]
MSIREIKNGVFHVRVRRTKVNGELAEKSRTVRGTKRDAIKIERSFIDELENSFSSLTHKIKTVADALDYYFTVKGNSISYRAVRAAADRLRRDIGHVDVTQPSLRNIFAQYWLSLETVPSKRRLGSYLSASHKNKVLKVLNGALELCRKHGFLRENYIYRCFDYHSELAAARDRVFSPSEIEVLLRVMKRVDSYLYWPFKFSVKNPIRKNDMKKLLKTNFNMLKPWVQFIPEKTQKGYGPKVTTLLELDEEIIDYFHSIPAECPYLFYRIINGMYVQIGDFTSHWYYILRLGRAEKPNDRSFLADVHWHDTKHNGVTHYLDNGYDLQDLKNLGIQYSDILVDRYYHFSAEKVLSRKQKSVLKSDLMAQAMAF